MRRLAAALALSLSLLAACSAVDAPARAPAAPACPEPPRDHDALVAALGPPRGATDVAFSADGKLLAIAANDRVVTVIDPAMLDVRARVLVPRPARGLAFDARGGLLVVDEIGDGYRVDVASQLVEHERVDATVPALGGHMAMSRDRRRAAFVQGSLVVTVDAALTKRVQHDGAWTHVSLSADGERLFAVDLRPESKIGAALWSTSAKEPLREVPAPVTGGALRPDGEAYAIARGAAEVSIFDAATGAATKFTLDEAVSTLGWSGDGRFLACGGRDRVLVWDVEKAAVAARVDRASPLGFTFRPDSGALAVVGSGDVAVVDLHGGAVVRVPVPTRVFELAWSPDGAQLAATAGSSTAAALVVDVPTRRVRAVAPGPDTPTSIAWSHDGATLAAIAGPGEGGRVRAFSATTGALRFELTDPRAKYADRVLFSSDDRLLVVTSGAGFSSWDAATGAFVAGVPLDGASDGVVVAPLPRGRSIALVAAGKSGDLLLLDLASGKRVGAVAHVHERVLAASFRGDGEVLCVGTEADAYLFEALHPSGADVTWQKRRLEEQQVSAAAWGPSGNVLFTGTVAGLVRAWDVVASRAMVLGVHVGSVREMGVSADGARLATSGGFEADLWDVAEGKLAARGPAAALVPIAWHPTRPVLALGLSGLRVLRVADGADVELAVTRGAALAASSVGLFGGDAHALDLLRVRALPDATSPLAPVAASNARAEPLDELIRGCPAYASGEPRLLTPAEPR
jgi:WD40 repeat protein